MRNQKREREMCAKERYSRHKSKIREKRVKRGESIARREYD